MRHLNDMETKQKCNTCGEYVEGCILGAAGLDLWCEECIEEAEANSHLGTEDYWAG